MEEELKALAVLRAQLAQAKGHKLILDEALRATPEYQASLQAQETIKRMEEDAAHWEESIRSEAVLMSAMTKFVERKFFGAVTVKEFTKVTITDPTAAVQWASASAPHLLTVNTKELEKVAKVIPLPFVAVEKEYRGQIASDLSSLLEVADADHPEPASEVS